MRYLLMFKPDENPPEGQHACRQDLPEMRALTAELTEAGVLLASHGLRPAATGARVTHSRGRVSVTDGPFAEAKELVAGVALVEVGSKAEAVDLAARFLAVAGGGQGEVREVVEAA